MNYLSHHGVQGMHWGERRYQNPDGTLTPLGKEHYGKTANKINNLYTEYDKYHNSKLYKSEVDHVMNTYKRGAIASTIPFVVSTALAATGNVPLSVYSVGIASGITGAVGYTKYRNMKNTYENGKEIADNMLTKLKNKKISEIKDYETIMLLTEPTMRKNKLAYNVIPVKSKRVKIDD